MSKPKKHSSEILKRVKSRLSPAEKENAKKRMQLAVRIDEARLAKGLSKSELADAMGKKNPSEVTKWLSGTHNFTIETLFALEKVLEISLVKCEEAESTSMHFQVVVSLPNTGANAGVRSMLKGLQESIPLVANVEGYA